MPIYTFNNNSDDKTAFAKWNINCAKQAARMADRLHKQHVCLGIVEITKS